MNKNKWSLRSNFMHADRADVFLMILGFIGAVGDGLGLPLRLYIISLITNDIGNSTLASIDPDVLRQSINKNALVLCYFAAGSWVACFLEGYCWTRTGERQASRMRARYLRAVLRQDVGYFDTHDNCISDVITSVSSDTLTIQGCISDKVPNFLANLVTFLGSYVAAFLMLWRLAIVGFPFVLLLVIPGLIYGRVLMGLATKVREEYVKAGSIAEQAISSIRTVYAFVGEAKTMARFTAALEGSIKLGLKQGLAKGLAVGSNGIRFAIFGFYAWYGSRLVMYHGAQGGTVDIVGAQVVLGGLAFGVGLSNVKYFSEAAAAGQRIMEMIKRVPEIDSENMEGLILESVSGDIIFEHVQFAYPSRPEDMVFRDFSLHVPAGKTVALVGGSGSGKSTAIALLQRFYNQLGGDILLDGVAIDNLQLKWLRSQMGLVSQEPALFATTIKENILFGREEATTEEVIEAAKVANAHSFISKLPQGYDTQVGERGAQLSGGQKQRIAIARAIIKRPQILLLDEATSALDSDSERVVQEALDKVSIGRTTIIIAHRLSTIRNVDTIAAIQTGQVVEIGSHSELTQIENGLYTSLVGTHKAEKAQGLLDEGSSSQAAPSNSLSIPSVNDSKLITRTHSSLSNMSPADSPTKLNKGVLVPSFWRLLALNLPEWKQAGLGCLSSLVYGAVQPVSALMSGSMMAVYFLHNHEEIKRKTMLYSLCYVGLSLLTFIVNVGQHYNFAYMGEYLTMRVREKVFSKILTFEVAWFDQEENSTGIVCSRLAKDANMVRSLVGDRMSLLVEAFSGITIAATLGLIISWRLAIVLIAMQPIIIGCYYIRKVLLKNMSQKAIKAQAQNSKLAADAVYNHRSITSFSSQSRILKMLDKAQEGLWRENIKQSFYTGFGLGTSIMLTTLTLSLQFWFGGKLLAHGYITAIALFQTNMILATTGRTIADAGSMTSDLAKGSNAVGSVFEVLDRVTQIKSEDPEGYKPKNITGHVEVCNVDFAYPNRPNVMVFRDFSLEIVAGKSTALVGHSGSGKSTIISLIERFYDPIKGMIKIDGRDIRSYSLRSLRKYTALVSQEPTLFGGTIRDNIIFGASIDVDESEVVEAAKAANAHDFIAGLKDGYGTWCGDKGVQLSGGQKQRIAIARAILRNPKILLLDEATSALDGHSEKIVQDALEYIMVGRTSVVVAHRLSTIQNCDVIAVLDKGEVVEIGTHESLLGKGPTGAYYSLFNLQRSC